MIHKKCGTQLVLDISGNFKVSVVSMNISTKGITPATIEINTSGSKKTSGLILTCQNCEQTYSSKEQFENEVLGECCVCRNKYPPSQLYVTEYVPLICDKCTKSDGKNIDFSSTQGRYLALYGTYFKDSNNPTLLTVMLKK